MKTRSRQSWRPIAGMALAVGLAARRAEAGALACGGQRLPASIARRRERICRRFDEAAPLKRFRRGVAMLDGSIGSVAKARRKGRISSGCADALKAELRDAKDRTERLLATLGAPRR